MSMQIEIFVPPPGNKYLVIMKDEYYDHFVPWNIYLYHADRKLLQELEQRLFCCQDFFFSNRDEYPYLPSQKLTKLLIKEIEKIMKD